MEDDDDDEFGDLYTDVLRHIPFPVSAAASAAALPPPSVPFSSATSPGGGPRSDQDLSSSSSDGDGRGRIFFGSSLSIPAASIPSQTLPTPTVAAKDAGNGDGGEDDDGSNWMMGRESAVAETTENWGEDDDERVPFRPANVNADCIPAEGMTNVLGDDDEEATRLLRISDAGAVIAGVGGIQAMEEVHDPVFGGEIGEDPDELGQALAIPGLSVGPSSSGTILVMSVGDAKPAQNEDWDSDSEDDLQIVLNDNGHELLGVGMNNINGVEDDDEDGEENLIILADEDHHHQLPITDEQQWGEEVMQPTGDSDKMETGDMSKVIGTSGIVGGTRIDYSNHGFHAQHHSLYKYIRPGATSVSGGPIAGAVPSATRPPLTSGPIAGRGRVDWRPAGGRGIEPAQKSYHTGFGVPSWASSSGVRSFGSGLDFTLPAHKMIFDIDIENFDEKPWKYPGADVSDFFNFGLDEDKWKDYCKQLEQLRLEATMQSKICVYEIGRSEQEYDPDLPPELAAAAGHHDVSADGGHPKADNGQIDFNDQGRGPTIMRPPIPTGRAIQVEIGYGERLPSIDTRPARNRNSDAIIEIVLQDSIVDPNVSDSVVEQHGKDLRKDHTQGLHENEDEGKLVSEYSTWFKHGSSGRNRHTAVRMPCVSEGGCEPSLPSESPVEHQNTSRSPLRSQNGEWLPPGHSRGKCDTAYEHLDDVMPSQSARSKFLGNNKKEKSADEGEINQTSETSSAIDDISREEMSMEQNCDEKDEKLDLINEIEDDTNVDSQILSKSGGENLAHSSKKLKLPSQIERTNYPDAGDVGDLRASNSESSREKSGGSKNYLRRHENSEVLQGRSRYMDEHLRHREGEEPNYRRKDDYSRGAWQEMDGSHSSKGRDDMSHFDQHREWDSNSANTARGRSFEKTKESEVTARRRREDRLHGRRVSMENTRRETSDETMSRHSGNLRSGDRDNRDGDFRSGKQSEDRGWRGHSREGSSRQREKDSYLVNHSENSDGPLIKRKRDECLRDVNTKMKYKEDSSQRKREREDVIANRKKDENTRMREKTDNHNSAKHKDDSWRYKDREDRQRLKQQCESALSHMERGQGQGLFKTTLAAEGKPLSRGVRYKEELTAIGSDGDYQDKDKRLPNENKRRGERTRKDSLPQKRGHGVPSREKQSNIDERSSRHERISLLGDRPPVSSNNLQTYKEKHRGNMKKNKYIEVNEQSIQVLGKRRHEARNCGKNEKAGMKGLREQESNKVSSPSFSKKDGQVRQLPVVQPANNSLPKQEVEDPTSDDENQQGSRRGRSKIERWTSNKERDYGVIDNKQKILVPSKAMHIDGNDNDAVQAEELPKTEGNNNSVDADGKIVNGGHLVEKMNEDRDSHLDDTVAKLKRRSERFKLPMPSEKEMASNRKQDNELQAPHSEAVMIDTEVRPERPARKRRWNGS